MHHVETVGQPGELVARQSDNGRFDLLDLRHERPLVPRRRESRLSNRRSAGMPAVLHRISDSAHHGARRR
jgi:hypothetical protein